MNDTERKEVQEAISAADNALYHLRAAREYLNSAGNWGVWDILGGGLISTFVKHKKMDNAQEELENAKLALRSFSRELKDVGQYVAIDVSDFLMFADYFWDGLFADIMVQSKINDAKRECDEAISKVTSIRSTLKSKLGGA